MLKHRFSRILEPQDMSDETLEQEILSLGPPETPLEKYKRELRERKEAEERYESLGLRPYDYKDPDRKPWYKKFF